METSFWFCISAVALILYSLAKHLVTVHQNLPPSPSISLPLIGHLYLFKKPLHRTLAKLSNQYGPILFLRFGSRPVLVVSSPEAAEECFTQNDIVFANRPRLLAGKHLGHDYTSLVWASYGHRYRNLRRVATLELLSTNRVNSSQNIREDEVRFMCQRLFQASRACGDEYQIVDIRSMFFELTLNVIMRMIAGKRYFGVETTGLVEATRLKEIVMETFQLSGVSNIGDFVPILNWVKLNDVEDKLVKLKSKREKFTRDLIDEHRRVRSDSSEFKPQSKTMVDVLLSLQENEPEYYTDEIVGGMIMALLSAGSDTSAGTMEWTLSNLLNNQESLLRARDEIEVNVGGNRLIEETDVGRLPYLNGIIKETMRMYPAGPLLVPHESSEECSIGGYTVPRGTMLLVNAWAIQHNPNLWEEPSKFRPERFQAEEVEKYKLLAFGAGRRRCPGEGLATKMIGLALGSLIQCFEWKRAGEEMVDMTEGGGLTMPKAQPLVAMCRPRPIMFEHFSQSS